MMQMDATIASLSSANVRIEGMYNQTLADEANVGAKVGMLWIDVEGLYVFLVLSNPKSHLCATLGTQYWGSSHSSNVDFITRITNRGKARGVSMGIYTSNSQWTPITGSLNVMYFMDL
jgi:hypothetical protein